MTDLYDLDLTSKAPVHNDLVEQIVLGSIMNAPNMLDHISDIIGQADFYQPKNGEILASIHALIDANSPATFVAVAEHLARREYRGVDLGYLHRCVELASTNPGDVAYFARIVRRASQLRLIEAFGVTAGQAARSSGDLDAILDNLHQKLAIISTGNPGENSYRVGDLVVVARAHHRAVQDGLIPPGLTTGLTMYDQLTGGHKPGQLIVPAGRPGMGKSTLVQNWAMWCASEEQRPAIIYSTEMPRQLMIDRLLATLTEINLNRFQTYDFTPEEDEKLDHWEKQLDSWPLELVDDLHTLPQIRAHARRARQRHGDLGMIAVDFLQRISHEGRHDSRNNVVGDDINGLKTLAMQLDTVTVVASQLSRGPENRDVKMPTLSDLRDSGEIEQAADIVAFVHREEKYNEQTPRIGEADLDIAKHRQGETRTIAIKAELKYNRFLDLPGTVKPPPQTTRQQNRRRPRQEQE